MKVKIIFSLIISAFISSAALGQARSPHSLYFMETIPQVSQLNPAMQPRANVYVALPNVHLDLHSDIAFKDVFQKHGDGHYTPIEREFKYDEFYKATGKLATMVNAGLEVDIFGFGYRTKRGYYSYSVSQHVGVRMAIPTDIFKITEKFFPDKSEFNFSPLRFEAMT